MSFNVEDAGGPREKKKSYVSLIIFLGVFIVMIGGFIGMTSRTMNDIGHVMEDAVQEESERCDVEVPAIIVDHSEREGDEGTGTLYAPVYSFEYEGEPYKITGNVWECEPHYEAGQEVNIMIDSSDPTHIYDPDNNIGTGLASFGMDALSGFAIFMIVPIVIMIAVIIVVAITVLKKVKSAQENSHMS